MPNIPHTPPARPTLGVVLGVVAALVMFATAAVILTTDTDAGTARLGLLFALIGTVIPVLLASVKSDQAATQTNGSMDERIHKQVTAALADRAEAVAQGRTEDRVAP